ncbi:MAG: DUF4340 domain-containing protein [Saprospiraceae bacterium]|nr:DUF4340 domain-containing protein [Saprospiraceae bacterium]
MNNKTLAIVFGALLLVYLLTKVLSGNRERSFDPNVISIDTAAVNRIMIHPAQGEDQFELLKTGADWQLQKNSEQYQATTTSVSALLSNMTRITADRIVSKDTEKYKDYAVDDEGGTRLELFSDQKKLGDIIVGRFNFNQATRSGISYLKKSDEPEVYSVEGFLSMSLSQGFDNYRNKTLTSINAGDLTKITIEGVGDATTVVRTDSIWRYPSGMEVDSAVIASYLNTVRSVTGSTFVNGRSDAGERIKWLKLEGNNMAAPVEIVCYSSQDTSHHFVIHSSTNEEGYFFSDSSGIYSRFFDKFPYPAN